MRERVKETMLHDQLLLCDSLRSSLTPFAPRSQTLSHTYLLGYDRSLRVR